MNVHFKNIDSVHSSVLRKQPVHILVFKTNLRFKKDIRQVEPLLGKHMGILSWNVDRNDIDNVLRIETVHVRPNEIVGLLTNAGYFCEELPD